MIFSRLNFLNIFASQFPFDFSFTSNANNETIKERKNIDHNDNDENCTIMTHHSFSQSSATKRMLLKADKDYGYYVAAVFFFPCFIKINTIIEVIIAVLEIGDNFGTQTNNNEKG